MKVLCIGDLHLEDKNKPQYDPVLDHIVDIATNRKPDIIVVMGDTLHKFRNMHQDPHYDACNFFYRLRDIAELYILIGNHDRRSPSEFLTEQNPFYALRNENRINIINTTRYVHIPPLNKYFVFIPYVPVGRFMEALEHGKLAELKDVVCIFAHQEFKGAEFNEIISTDGDEWDHNNPLVISGHIHKYARLENNIIYVGTPMQTTRSEIEDKSISLFTFGKKSPPREERIFINMKRMYKLTLSVDEFLNWTYDPNHFWHIEFHDTRENLTRVQSHDKYYSLSHEGVTFAEKQITQEITEPSEDETSNYSFIQALLHRTEGKPEHDVLVSILKELGPSFS